MNIHKAWLVFKKDWLEIKRSWQVLLPIIILPIIFSVVLPVIVLGISSTPTPTTNMSTSDFQSLIPNLPAENTNPACPVYAKPNPDLHHGSILLCALLPHNPHNGVKRYGFR